MRINKVAVIGAGTMGVSISVTLATHGLTVILKDLNEDILKTALVKIDKIFQSLSKKGMSDKEIASSKQLIKTTTSYSELKDVDLVIEAVIEKLDVKADIFGNLDQICRQNTIFATNTSSLSITEIAAHTKNPHRVIGLHFFNPAHLMKLVEVIPGLDTEKEVVEQILKFGQKLDKLAIQVEECASFLVNRLLGRYVNEALWCLQEGIAGVVEIDKVACDYVMPIGPLALRDMNGADIGLAVADFNYQEYGERFSVPPILKEMVKRNWLGRKTNLGFYQYNQEAKSVAVNQELESLIQTFACSINHKEGFRPERLFLPMINEAFLVLQEKICSLESLDPACMAGLGMRKGPLALSQEIGLPTCLADLESLYSKYGERFRPAPLLKRYVRAGRKHVLSISCCYPLLSKNG